MGRAQATKRELAAPDDATFGQADVLIDHVRQGNGTVPVCPRLQSSSFDRYAENRIALFLF
jgi:hypothetical protein